MVRTPMKRKPTSPGEILREEFLVPMGLTQKELADHLGCDIKVINRIVNERGSVTADMALKLGAAFDMSPEFWLNAQRALDLYNAKQSARKLPKPFSKQKMMGTEVA
ncbi:HigA family addiction module antitoxin [bacterium]|nr:HigA family addiction module antitoxin [bacterium]